MPPQSSGVQLGPECLTEFEKMKLGGKGGGPRFIIYKISADKKFIEVEYVAAAGEGFAELKAKLPDDDCRYVIYDALITTKSGVETNKLVFIAWSDDNAPVKPKMLYASSKDAIKKSLNGVQEEFQATERGDLEEEEVNKKAAGNK